MAKKPKKEVATTGGAMPSYMAQYAGEGQEEITRDDITMPRLKIGQSKSPEVEDGVAKVGDLIHNITRGVLAEAGKPLRFIPICYSKEYIIWYDRNGPHKGGIANRARRVIENGQVRYKWDRPGITIEDKLGGKMAVKYNCKKYIDEDGLGEWGSQVPGDSDSPPAAAAHHNYVVMLPEHDNELIAISLSKSAEGKARQFNTMLKMGTPPTYARIYSVETYQDQNNNGDRFANVQFSGDYNLVDSEDFFLQLRDLHQNLKEKGINVDYSDDDPSNDATTAEDDGF